MCTQPRPQDSTRDIASNTCFSFLQTKRDLVMTDHLSLVSIRRPEPLLVLCRDRCRPDTRIFLRTAHISTRSVTSRAGRLHKPLSFPPCHHFVVLLALHAMNATVQADCRFFCPPGVIHIPCMLSACFWRILRCQVLRDGAEAADEVASETLGWAKEAMGISTLKDFQ